MGFNPKSIELEKTIQRASDNTKEWWLDEMGHDTMTTQRTIPTQRTVKRGCKNHL